VFTFISTHSGITLPQHPSFLVSSESVSADGSTRYLIRNIVPGKATDAWFHQQRGHLACFDGALVNADSLVNAYALSGTGALLEEVLINQDTGLLGQFHGQFSGMAAYPDGSAWFFANQTGSSRLYYWHAGDLLIVSTSLALIVAILRSNMHAVSIDPIGARMLMSLGFTLAERTTIANTKLLEPGHCLHYEGGILRKDVYHSFNSEPLYTDMSAALPILDDLFKQAVQAEYAWDQSHGRGHLSFLSGGLDSRMAVATAASLGFTGIECLNFSQSGYPDHTVARAIASRLGAGYHFFALDGGHYLRQMEDALEYNDGQIIFHGAAHLFAALDNVPTSEYGILHSGQVGDLILGSYLRGPRHEPAGCRDIGLNPDFDPDLSSEILRVARNYPNHEVFALYNRAFNAASNGDLACAISNYAISPFLYPHFAQYCLNIDPSLRFGNKLYLRWFRQYQALAAGFKWEKTGLPLTAGQGTIAVAKLIRRTRDKLARMGWIQARSMNPFESWLKEGTPLHTELTDRFNKADQYGILSGSDAGGLYRRSAGSANVISRLQAYTAAYSLNRLLGGSAPWIPKRYPGGFTRLAQDT